MEQKLLRKICRYAKKHEITLDGDASSSFLMLKHPPKKFTKSFFHGTVQHGKLENESFVIIVDAENNITHCRREYILERNARPGSYQIPIGDTVCTFI